ncbi:hypothetical protein AB0J13_06945 [Streptomyces anulatus]|uniref:hypothetical protein n=1 Tax=Streptomyces anulatus TaxID=1892 RepID=UPI0033C6675E
MLINVGCPIDHAQAEIARIQSRAFKVAVRLADVTGNDAAVREYLGLPKALTTDFRCHLSRPTAGTEQVFERFAGWVPSCCRLLAVSLPGG